jgi:hypothetical protein
MTLAGADCSITQDDTGKSLLWEKIVKKQAFTCRPNLVQIK